MSKPFWIIENFVKEKSFKELADAVKSAGFPLLELNGDYQRKMLDDVPAGCVICKGSIQMVREIKDYLSEFVYPGAYCTFENFECSKYYSYIGGDLFNDKYALVPLSELARNKFFFYSIFGKEALIFIRPNSGDKLFQAQLLDLIDFDRFVELNKKFLHELVLVSTPKTITWEGRFVVSREEIIAHSTYMFQGQITKIPSVPEDAKKFVKKILSLGYYPDPVFCIDVCQDKDGDFWLLELTSFSSAGLYECDKKKIVEKVSEIALKDYNR